MRRAIDPDDRLLTIEEYERLPEEPDGSRVELVRGRLVREPPPAEEHGWLQVKLSHEDPPTVRGPDLSFLSNGRIDGGYPARKLRRIAPDLAVEIKSPSNRARELVDTAHQYLDAGARLVWIVNPTRRTVTVYRSRTDVTQLHIQDTLDGGDVLPGLQIPLARLFTV